MLTPRDELLPQRSPPSYSSISSASTLQSQRQAWAAQDADLNSLSTGVRGVRDVAHVIHTEVGAQNALLDDIGRDVEAANGRIDAANQRLGAVEASPYGWRNFCRLLWPLVLLIVMVIGGLKRMLFG